MQAGTRFGDYVFPSDSQVFSIYFIGDLRGRYAFEILPDSHVTLQVGGGLTIIDTEVSLFEAVITDESVQVDSDTGDIVRGFGVVPLVYLRVGYEFGEKRKYVLYAEGDGYTFDQDTAYDVTAKFAYRINPKWEVAAGWRWTGNDLDLPELRNDFQSTGGLLHVAYSF